MPTIRRMAALGSSFAAGPTIQPVEDPGAMRSARNYPRLLSALLEADLADLTVSGATTATIVDTPQQTATGQVYPPQIEGVPTDADLVTITAGGNDLRLVGSMLYAAWSSFEPGGQMQGYLGAGFEGGIPQASDQDIAAVAHGLSRIVTGVRERAPKARVVLVDYLTIISDTTVENRDAPFGKHDRTAFRQLQSALAAAYVLAAEQSRAELLAMSAISQNHGLGSEEPWVFGFRSSLETTAGSFHPNEAGMQAVADHLLAQVSS